MNTVENTFETMVNEPIMSTSSSTPKGLLMQHAKKNSTSVKTEAIQRVMNTFAAELRNKLNILYSAMESIQNQKTDVIQDLMPNNILSLKVDVNATELAKKYVVLIEDEVKIASVFNALLAEYELLTGKTFVVESEIE